MLHHLRRLFGKSLARRGKVPHRQARLRLEPLQDRIAPSASPASLHGHELLIHGSHGTETILVTESGGKVHVYDNHHVYNFPAARVHSIVFKSGTGNDRFTNHTNLPSLAYGGPGKDTLVGGSGNDTLVGGSGDDLLEGGKGNDVLKAGTGNDTLVAGTGHDTLVGGTGHDVAEVNGDDTSSGMDSEDIHVQLSGPAGGAVQGNAELAVQGSTLSELKVEIEQALPNQTLYVFLDGNQVGQLTTDANGNATLDVTSFTSPVTVGNGTTLTVMDGVTAGANTVLSGTVGASVGHEGRDVGVQLSAPAGGSAQGEAEVQVQAGTLIGVKVQVENAPASQSLTVLVDGSQVGTITTDAEGQAEVVLNNFATPVTVQDGATFTIQDSQGNTVLSGTISLSNDGNGEDQNNDVGVGLQAPAGGQAQGEAELQVQGTTTLTGLKVEVENAPASQSLTILIDGNQVGTLSTDGEGEGHQRLTLASPVTIQDGSTFSIQDSQGNTVLSGTISLSNNGNNGGDN